MIRCIHWQCCGLRNGYGVVATVLVVLFSCAPAVRGQGGFPPNGAWVYGRNSFFASSTATPTFHVPSAHLTHHGHHWYHHHPYYHYHYPVLGVAPIWYSSGISLGIYPGGWYYRVGYGSLRPWCPAPTVVVPAPPFPVFLSSVAARPGRAGKAQPVGQVASARPGGVATTIRPDFSAPPSGNPPPIRRDAADRPIASSRPSTPSDRPRYVQQPVVEERTVLRVEAPDIDRSADLQLPPLGDGGPAGATPAPASEARPAEELPAPSPAPIPADLVSAADEILAAGGYREAATAFARLSLEYGDTPELLLRRFVAQTMAGEWESAEVLVSIAEAWGTPLIQIARAAGEDRLAAIVRQLRHQSITEAMAARALSRLDDPATLEALAVWLWMSGDRARSDLFMQRSQQLKERATKASPVPLES